MSARTQTPEPSLIEYPLDFPIKIAGLMQPGFAEEVVKIVRQHAPDFEESTVEMRASSAKKYLSLTVTIRATSREQLDALYQDLCDHPAVKWAL